MLVRSPLSAQRDWSEHKEHAFVGCWLVVRFWNPVVEIIIGVLHHSVEVMSCSVVARKRMKPSPRVSV